MPIEGVQLPLEKQQETVLGVLCLLPWHHARHSQLCCLMSAADHQMQRQAHQGSLPQRNIAGYTLAFLSVHLPAHVLCRGLPGRG